MGNTFGKREIKLEIYRTKGVFQCFGEKKIRGELGRKTSVQGSNRPC
jgi:hypothetical protein